jgi:hypothetical protein
VTRSSAEKPRHTDPCSSLIVKLSGTELRAQRAVTSALMRIALTAPLMFTVMYAHVSLTVVSEGLQASYLATSLAWPCDL